MGWNRWCVPTSTSTSPLDGTCVAGMVTGPDPQGEVAETVLGIATVDEATLGLAANSIEKAIITTAPSLGTALVIMWVKPHAPTCDPRLSCARPDLRPRPSRQRC
jgi:hypothetical protein